MRSSRFKTEAGLAAANRGRLNGTLRLSPVSRLSHGVGFSDVSRVFETF
jgi:hypothetical protein